MGMNYRLTLIRKTGLKMPNHPIENRFHVDRGVLDVFPGMRLVVAVALGIDNTSANPGIDTDWVEAWCAAGVLDVPNAQSHPRVRALREDFKAFGVSMKRFPISIESMLRRALKGGEPFRINPLVDLYNCLSLRHVCPAGAVDLDAASAGLALRFTDGTERFTALDSQESVPVDAGEISYATADTVLTRHFMWRQAREGLVGPGTRNVFFCLRNSRVGGAGGGETYGE